MKGPYVILSPIAKSHPFEERKAKVGPEEDPLKIGRAVARLKPTPDNAIFDCKVLSRNHAIMWCKDDQFFLRDTKSSNGTFVNNERLTVSGTESESRMLNTGDIIQFGVEIVESSNKVAHGCIYAMIQLFDSEGRPLHAAASMEQTTPSGTMAHSPSIMSTHQLFQMQQYLSEALYRVQAKEKKIAELEEILEESESAVEHVRKDVVNEDRLLSRIETLEAMLAASSKSVTNEKVREDMLEVLEDRGKFENITKEAIRRAQEEKAEADLRLADIDRSLVATEEECTRLRVRLQATDAMLAETVTAHEAKQVEIMEAQDLLLKKENRILQMEDKIRAEEMRADGAIVDLEIDRTMPRIVRNLISLLENPTTNFSDDDESLNTLIECLTERGFIRTELNGIIENGDISPSSSKPSCEPEISMATDKNEELLQSLREDIEICLKDKLELQSHLKEVEAMVDDERSKVEKLQCELEALTGPLPDLSSASPSSSSTCPSNSSMVLVSDNNIPLIIILSLLPFLMLFALPWLASREARSYWSRRKAD